MKFFKLLKLTFFAFIVSFKYLFKKSQEKNNIQVSFSGVGSSKSNYYQWYKDMSKEDQDTRRYMYGLSYGKSYIFVFSGTDETKEYIFDDNTIFVEFSTNFKGVKAMFLYLYKLQPKYFRIISVSESILYALVVRFVLKIKTIVDVRGLLYYEMLFGKKTIKKKVAKVLLKLAYKKADLVYGFASHLYDMEYISKRSDYYVSDLSLAVGNYKHAKGYSLLEAQKEPNLKIIQFVNKFEMTIFNFSRVEELLNIEEIIDFFLEVRTKTNKNIGFLMIGDGSILERIKEKYKQYDCIYFTGWLNHTEAFPVIKHLDLMIGATPGYTVFEVGYLGIPTISYNYHLMQETIIPNINGYLVDKSSPWEMVDCILDYVEKPDEDRKYMKKMAKELWQKRFSLENIEKERLKYTNKIFKHNAYCKKFSMH
jgi:glycosyltransferase involved in cell wall biosynthesis